MNVHFQPAPAGIELADDLLIGGYEIAAFLFAKQQTPLSPRAQRRKFYHIAETSRIPVFRLGSRLCARRSALMAWIAQQKQRGGR